MTQASAPAHRKKLIEVSLPLEAINRASAREKSIRHGHPSTLHLWWARRPLAACRAVLFAQLVDDPSAWPDEFPTEEDQARERKRLHGIIEEMVPWKATNNEYVLNKARYEIAHSLARRPGARTPPPRNKPEQVLAWLARYAPPVCDPFCGGGSIPLEAHSDSGSARPRIGPQPCRGARLQGHLRNPAEIRRPVARSTRIGTSQVAWNGAQGLADDIRHYGRWMRNEAESRIGHLYPNVAITEAIATARPDLRAVCRQGVECHRLALGTHRRPRPTPWCAALMCRSFLHSCFQPGKAKKRGSEIVHDETAQDGWRFAVRTGELSPDEETNKKLGTKAGKAQDFLCGLTGVPIQRPYIQAEGKAGRLSKRLMAIVATDSRGRLYFSPTNEAEQVANTAEFEELVSGARTGFLSGSTPTRAMITGGVSVRRTALVVGDAFSPTDNWWH